MRKTEIFYHSANEIDEIHGVIWKPEGDVRAVVQISHGMVEYINRYEEFAGFLTSQGIAVAGNDHMGHGQSIISEDEWGYFASENASEKAVADLYALSRRLKREYAGAPFFLLGHSMGSFLARRYAMVHGKELTGLILVGTGSQPSLTLLFGRFLVKFMELLKGERYRSRLVNQCIFGLYNKKIKHIRTPQDWISRNEENVDAYRNDRACMFLFTLNGYETLISTLSYIQDKNNINRLPTELPMLFVSGEEDPVGNYGKGVRQVCSAYRRRGVKEIQLKLYPEDRHEVLNESDRQDVYQYIYKWIAGHITA